MVNMARLRTLAADIAAESPPNRRIALDREGQP